MVKDNYKGTNVKVANVDYILVSIEEMFKQYDLNDNNSLDFNNFMDELKLRYNKYDKSYKNWNIIKDKLTAKQLLYILENE